MIHARKDYTARIVDTAGKIPTDEPVFLIRAQDPAAKAALEAWCKKTRELGGNELAEHLEKNHIPLMEAWPIKKKVADCDKALLTDYDAIKSAKEQRDNAKLKAEKQSGSVDNSMNEYMVTTPKSVYKSAGVK